MQVTRSHLLDTGDRHFLLLFLSRNIYNTRPFLFAWQMVDYLSALLSICFMTFLGFTDDVLDLPWR